MDRIEIHPAIVTSALLSAALIAVGILWMWFPGSEDVADEPDDDESLLLAEMEEAPDESLRLNLGEQAELVERYADHYADNPAHFLHVTVDRPMYRPGQTINWRVWHVTPGSLAGPEGGTEMEIELETPRGQSFAAVTETRRGRMAQGGLKLDEDVPGGNWTLRISDGDEEYERNILVANFEPPRFRKTIEFSRAAYRPGEEVTAEIEIMRDTGQPAAGLGILGYAQVEGEEVAPVRAHLDDTGRAEVSFTLPSAIASDDAVLAVSITEGSIVETEIRPIPLALERINIDFHPEGGRLVEGLTSRVYFEATDLGGNPVEFEGYLRDEAGEKILELSTDDRGRGRFEFTPQATGASYAVQVTDPELKDPHFLPSVSRHGCVLRVYDDFDSQHDAVRAGVWCSQKRTVVILGAMADEIFDAVKMEAGPEEPAVAYLRSDGELPRPAGVVRVTVLEDRQGIFPLAERVTFRGRRNQLEIRVRPQKDAYTPGETVLLEVETIGADGQPVAAELTRAVVDDRLHAQANDETPSVLGRLLLEADDLHFWGDVDEADRYFALDDPAMAGALDLLMGSRGWRDEEKLRGYFLAGGEQQLEWPPPIEPVAWDSEDDGIGAFDEPLAAEAEPMPQPRREPRARARSGARAPSEVASTGAGGLADFDGIAAAPPPTLDDVVAGPTAGTADLGIETTAEEQRSVAEAQPFWMRDDDAGAFSAWQAQLKTNRQGTASDEFELSQAIGAYRITVEGVADNGLVGVEEIVVPVELPLSVAIRLPEVMSGGDSIDLPITVRNATDEVRSATVNIEASGPVDLERSHFDVDIDPESTTTEYASLRIHDAREEITIQAWVEGDGFADGAERTARIEPSGYRRSWHASGIVSGQEVLEIPLDAMTDVGLTGELAAYANPVSEALEGVASMARRPTGCFEQTSSSNHPNVLIYRHLEAADQLDSATESRLKAHLEHGYERMIGYEVAGGGFDWFGRAPSNAPLSAWGLVQFTEMEDLVTGFDSDVIDRTARWLRRLRDGEGGWRDERGAWARTRGAQRRPAELFVLYGLARAGAIEGFEEQLRSAQADALESDRLYEVAMATAALAYADYDQAVVDRAVSRLTELQNDDGSWTVDQGSSWSFARGRALDVETTAIAVLAILRAGGPMAAAAQGADWLVSQKSGNGWWGSTQATVAALDARITYESRGTTAESGTLSVSVADETVADGTVDADDRDPLRLDVDQFQLDRQRAQLILESDTSIAYDLELHWRVEQFEANGQAPIAVVMELGDDLVRMGDEISISVRLENREDDALGMSIARLSLPGGVEVSPAVLDDLVERTDVDFYETQGRELILYFEQFDGFAEQQFRFSATAAVPGDYEVPAALAYPYYRDESFWSWGQQQRLKIEIPQ